MFLRYTQSYHVADRTICFILINCYEYEQILLAQVFSRYTQSYLLADGTICSHFVLDTSSAVQIMGINASLSLLCQEIKSENIPMYNRVYCVFSRHERTPRMYPQLCS